MKQILASFFIIACFCSWEGQIPYENSEKATINFARKKAYIYKLNYLNCTTTYFEKFYLKSWGFALTGNESTFKTLEEIRPIALDLANSFLELVNTDENFKEYQRLRRPRLIDLDKVSLEKVIAFKVAYWDKNFDRPLAPYIADFRFMDGKFSYYYADPKTQALQLILTETLEEAMKKMESHAK